MKSRNLFWMSVLLGLLVAFGAGSGYWAYAQQGHGSGGHMTQGDHHGEGMMEGHKGGMMGMMGGPMMHGDTSDTEVAEYCERMQEHHEKMREKRRERAKKLDELVKRMKQASGEEKVRAMEETLLELVDQHRKRSGRTMKSMHSMMGTMMGMHRMGEEKRHRMMQQMQDCPMMGDMHGSMHGSGSGASSGSGAHDH